MTHRYCPECEKWLETMEYTVDDSGETVCPDHKAVHGYIPSVMYDFYTERDFRIDNRPSMYNDFSKMLQKAKEQNLVE
jgi:hypothetical protein